MFNLFSFKRSYHFLVFLLSLTFFVAAGNQTFAYYKLIVPPNGTIGAAAGLTPDAITGSTAPAGLPTTVHGNVQTCSSGKIAIQDFCSNTSSICTMIQTASDEGIPIAACFPAGVEYCFQDSDCTALGRPVCLNSAGSLVKFKYSPGTNLYVGTCGTLQSTSESNVMTDALCSGIKLVTGKAGRAFVAICVVVLGVLFFTGKISWNMILAAALGCGGIFGAPSIVGVVTGKPLTCS
jgi:type IV secretory pathway VirB2 component (pilin)